MAYMENQIPNIRLLTMKWTYEQKSCSLQPVTPFPSLPRHCHVSLPHLDSPWAHSINFGHLHISHRRGSTGWPSSLFLKGCVDIKSKVAFQYMNLILKRNLCFDVSTTLKTSYLVSGHPVVYVCTIMCMTGSILCSWGWDRKDVFCTLPPNRAWPHVQWYIV